MVPQQRIRPRSLLRETGLEHREPGRINPVLVRPYPDRMTEGTPASADDRRGAALAAVQAMADDILNDMSADRNSGRRELVPVLDEDSLSAETVAVLDRRTAAGCRVPRGAIRDQYGTVTITWDLPSGREPERPGWLQRRSIPEHERLHWRDDEEIVAATTLVPDLSPELNLAEVAHTLAGRIIDSRAWRDEISHGSRVPVAPEAEASRIGRHAAAIAVWRRRVGIELPPLPTSPRQTVVARGQEAISDASARARRWFRDTIDEALADELPDGPETESDADSSRNLSRAWRGRAKSWARDRISGGADPDPDADAAIESVTEDSAPIDRTPEQIALDRMVDALRHRVANLWAYSEQIHALSDKLRALDAANEQLQNLPQMNALASRIGDRTVADQFERDAATAQVLAVDVAEMTRVLGEFTMTGDSDWAT
ncbi:hypothetical protein [Tsukamurella sp. NPDC003166]|uniref:hypothetical protein n=1 Tax=Tsukamurella sp. NPDC003166 TaxID=3154444 RepID=UPI0033BF2483